MKRMLSIFLIAVLLISLLSTTVFGETISEITLSFTVPSVGDSISTETLAAAISSVSNGSPIPCTVKNIYTDIAVSELNGLNSETYSSFLEAKNNNVVVTGSYTSQQYIAIVVLKSKNITNDTDITFIGATGDKLFLETSLYVYVTFTPTDNSSAGDTSTGDTSTGNTSYTPNNNTHDVSVTYQEGESSATIYSVDIVWESMEFTYTAASEGTWNPSTHTFIDVEGASWSFANNKITVTNHSNTAINATFSYAPAANFDTVSGAFVDSSGTALTNATLTLNSAVDSTREQAPSGTAFLSLSGELPSRLESKTVCGTVTVTIN